MAVYVLSQKAAVSVRNLPRVSILLQFLIEFRRYDRQPGTRSKQRIRLARRHAAPSHEQAGFVFEI